ncbi:hypothetical protein HDV03_000262 [Kappamyces sp. JEL0829]|nr:hypothetical protein HDV03_000262 [Kappamyces sp. JEL0829]
MSAPRKQQSDQDISVSSEYTVNVDSPRSKNKFLSATTVMVSTATNGVKRGTAVAGSVLQDFKEFLNRGNVVDLAVGLVIGASFTAVVNSMVKDLITPLISLAMDAVSLSDTFVVMACPKANGTGPRPPSSTCSGSFTTVLAAQTAGAITWNYGSFINNVITFLITALIVFFIVKAYAAAFRRKPAEKTTKECPECCKDVPLKATRCAFCTSAIKDVMSS